MIKKMIHKIKIRMGVYFLRTLNRAIWRSNWPHWKKKQFWRDLFKSDQLREDLLNDIIKTL